MDVVLALIFGPLVTLLIVFAVYAHYKHITLKATIDDLLASIEELKKKSPIESRVEELERKISALLLRR